ncbi:GNAT family N-acetyltransferase [Niallia sp. XMNu-256]|uniref:GNAT family N-acetyltransferase n=1 Tax=Niallia sp. XMNu-256 TaxID=3082444 RepID=UPI0030D55C56
MEIRMLTSLEDAEQYRCIRLESLQNNPEFVTSYEEEKAVPVQNYKDEFHMDDSYTFGAFDNHELVGIITLYRDKPYKLGHRAHIGAMYVSPSKRGSGIGKALMKEAINKAKSLNGIEQIYLAVVSNNESAKKLYSSLDFQVFGTEKRGLRVEENIYYDVDFMILYL